MHRVLERQLRKLNLQAAPPTAEQWQAFLERVDKAYADADQDRYTLERSLELSSAEMKKRFQELRRAQAELVEASRKAGMADVATSVLHNVGNVLNSVNVSTHVVSEAVKGSARAGLGKAIALLRAQPKPGRFLDEDPRGAKWLAYLEAVHNSLAAEHETTLRELNAVGKSLDHIKTAVGNQLAAARGDRLRRHRASCRLDELARRAIELFTDSPGVHFVCEVEPLSLTTDEHKALDIVANLVANARDAVRARGDGKVVITSERDGDAVLLHVVDEGVGIAPELIERIFTHGFTTKSDGHGFGLHASACAAVELGGSLRATSAGPGQGATFTLTLPLVAKQEAAA